MKVHTWFFIHKSYQSVVWRFLFQDRFSAFWLRSKCSMCRYYMEVLASLWWWESPESCSCTLCKGSHKVLGRLQNLIRVMRRSSTQVLAPNVEGQMGSPCSTEQPPPHDQGIEGSQLCGANLKEGSLTGL